MTSWWCHLSIIQLIFILLVSCLRITAGCGGCSTCALTDTPCVPSQCRTKIISHRTGWWWNTQTIYATTFEYYRGTPYCCAGYKLNGDHCVIDSRDCGGCDSNGVATQPACIQKVHQKHSRQATIPYSCPGWWFVSKTCFRTYTYYKLVRLELKTCCAGYNLVGSTCVKDTSPKTCGISKYSSPGARNTFIVGGTDARVNEFPWILRLTIKSTGMCGATLIGRDWALTAAHCVNDFIHNPYLVGVIAGDHRYKTHDSTEQFRFAHKIFVHPDFTRKTYENDLALIRFSSPMTLNDDVQPACLPDTCNDYTGLTTITMGWGRASAGPRDSPIVRHDVLQYALVTILSKSKCGAFVGPMDTFLCVSDGIGDHTKSACFGDSGGPLLLKDTSGRFTVIGIASFVAQRGCAMGLPSGFTDIGPYLRWIKQLVH